MRIKSIELRSFKRFARLTINDVPDTARLVVLAGPNGIGKSSLFDAFNLWSRVRGGRGWSGDADYYDRTTVAENPLPQLGTFSGNEAYARVDIEFYNANFPLGQTAANNIFHIRTAYRNDPHLAIGQLNRIGSISEDNRFEKMIETDASVTNNYQRLVSDAFDRAFDSENADTRMGDWRENVIGELRDAIERLFPQLTLKGLGSPMRDPTFRFKKGAADGFVYRNLSGGEKSAFDLLLDIVVKRAIFSDSIFCIDEPEAHLNVRIQGALLLEMIKMIPDNSQLWIATHSIGMLRAARDIENEQAGSVAFLDFDGHDFDHPVALKPITPSRRFWASAMRIALDDMAELIAPRLLIVCEGNPAGAVAGKNTDHDARCYTKIFGDAYPDIAFTSGGNSHDVASDRLGISSTFPAVVKGTKVQAIIDLDDHGADDVNEFARRGIKVLSRRNLESYLWDDEVLRSLCASKGADEHVEALLSAKQTALSDSVSRGNAADDLKPAAPAIYSAAKRLLKLTQVGNDNRAFERNVLAGLICPGMATYDILSADLFGALK